MNPVDRDWLILMGPDDDGTYPTIEGNADFDSHDYVSNLKPRADDDTTTSNAISPIASDSDDYFCDLAAPSLESIKRDGKGDQQARGSG